MMLVEDFKKGINNSLKEIQENIAKQVEVLKKQSTKIPQRITEKYC
jgi:chaperonin cofactor prefoldin